MEYTVHFQINFSAAHTVLHIAREHKQFQTVHNQTKLEGVAFLTNHSSLTLHITEVKSKSGKSCLEPFHWSWKDPKTGMTKKNSLVSVSHLTIYIASRHAQAVDDQNESKDHADIKYISFCRNIHLCRKFSKWAMWCCNVINHGQCAN